MCQLCILKDIAKRDRWPTPLAPDVTELTRLVLTAHHELNNNDVRKGLLKQLPWHATRQIPLPSDTNSLLERTTSLSISSSANHETFQTDDLATSAHAQFLITVRLLSHTLTLLDQARQDWWNSPAKQLQRREMTENEELGRLTELQRINGKCVDMVADMTAKLGGFARWNLGLEGGLRELE